VTDAPTEREGESPWTALSRRKVVQWGLAYAAAAWTLLQVIEYFGETYAWPPAIRQIAALALPLGLLFVLVLAWYHGDKGEQKVSRPEVAILAVLALGVGAVLWTYVTRLDESAWEPADGLANIRHVVPKDAASVAVLPFVDMSQAKDQEYFADGLSEEILNALAAIPGVALVAVHSDGSRGRPFKAPGEHEPNIPDAATHVVAVVGLDALGAPIDEAHVHRPRAVQALVGAATHSDASVIARTMVHARGGRKHVSDQAFIVVVNKSASDPAAAASLARAIQEAGAPRVVTTELHDTAAPVLGVFTS